MPPPPQHRTMADNAGNTESGNAGQSNSLILALVNSPAVVRRIARRIVNLITKPCTVGEERPAPTLSLGDGFEQWVNEYRTDDLDRYVEDIPDREQESGLGTAGPSGDQQNDEEADLATGNGAEQENEDDEDEDVEDDQKCPICLLRMKGSARIKLCGHTFCRQCLQRSFRVCPKCPYCNQVLTVVSGNMPDGFMRVECLRGHVDGYESFDAIQITYTIPDGVQGDNHYHPGFYFYGTTRFAYVPNTEEGVQVCRLLWIAFQFRHTFTVGRSITLNQEDMVTWNDIHHKTSVTGGPEVFGYPDPDYLRRVTEELAAKGITAEFIKGFNIPF